MCVSFLRDISLYNLFLTLIVSLSTSLFNTLIINLPKSTLEITPKFIDETVLVATSWQRICIPRKSFSLQPCLPTWLFFLTRGDNYDILDLRWLAQLVPSCHNEATRSWYPRKALWNQHRLISHTFFPCQYPWKAKIRRIRFTTRLSILSIVGPFCCFDGPSRAFVIPNVAYHVVIVIVLRVSSVIFRRVIWVLMASQLLKPVPSCFMPLREIPWAMGRLPKRVIFFLSLPPI